MNKFIPYTTLSNHNKGYFNLRVSEYIYIYIQNNYVRDKKLFFFNFSKKLYSFNGKVSKKIFF